jgi:hypothetical protein
VTAGEALLWLVPTVGCTGFVGFVAFVLGVAACRARHPKGEL